ncbi:HsdM family class I SAM-dependent methyltransferase [Methylobacterium indicum]|uniref:site-specific DNA-methyltransferase (adenine-specific) n=1 Tax=Methylobacterium indicum TaxID=1775910 RepID=A0ABR5HJ16_9HYPH|nr:N-6 DNA methylase [Methylobacterium indicum]KMO22857.1 N-6 DNA methylase [Methylobacterium indicum]KMO26577.1 N-6 DNA methylase [Methylobacterium indicum]
MSSIAFQTALRATGYLDHAGRPAPGLTETSGAIQARLRTVLSDGRVGLHADAVFTAQGAPTTIFKDAGQHQPSPDELRSWYEAAWNVGVAPLLWIITPTDVRLYDCYAAPAEAYANAEPPELERYSLADPDRIRALDTACGRLATETGAFWSSAVGSKINRRHRVDRELLAEISALEDRLVGLSSNETPATGKHLARDLAQRFIGRCIFTWYLLDRQLAQPFLPEDIPPSLTEMFGSPTAAFRLFEWLRCTFNGDLFPMDDPGAERDYLTEGHLELMREFIEGRSLIPERRGQGRLFRFRFNVIPVDLISSIYQQFARTSAAEEAHAQGLHYTPIELVHLTLDPVFEQLPLGARVIDPACGSGAFLVEAFRRLVWRASQGKPASRKVVRNILHNQLFGLDINPSALGIAAFSLYLAALELDEDPIQDLRDLKFDHLIGRTLFEADSLADELPRHVADNTFEAVVGNPPWTFVGRRGASPKRIKDDEGTARPRRSPDWAFLNLAARLAGENGRVGMVMKATPFFSKDPHAISARKNLFNRLASAALINLSFLRREELFPDATGPALLFLARCALSSSHDRLLVGSIPWTPDFRRTGVFHIGPGEIRSIPLQRVLAAPPFLKAATFGSVRDGWLIERLDREFPTLDNVLDSVGIRAREHRGQGFKIKGREQTPSPLEYFSLKVITPENFTSFRLGGSLDEFTYQTLHRTRNRAIFNGPLLLCSKVGSEAGAQRGRYSAAVVESDHLYTQGFFGISFANADKRYAYLLSGILNSSLTAFQFALGGPTWGLERPTVEPHDLLSLRIPYFSEVSDDRIRAVIDAERAVASAPERNDLLAALDHAVYELYDLEPEECVLARDSIDRARYLIFENRVERGRFVAPPAQAQLRAYAGQLATVVNAYLRARGERHLEALIYPQSMTATDWAGGIPGVAAVRFVMAKGAPGSNAVVHDGKAEDLETLAAALRGQFETDIPPYLNERRQLRIYGDKDLYVLKPAEVRYWTCTAGLNDADVILADHWVRRRNAATHV